MADKTMMDLKDATEINDSDVLGLFNHGKSEKVTVSELQGKMADGVRAMPYNYILDAGNYTEDYDFQSLVITAGWKVTPHNGYTRFERTESGTGKHLRYALTEAAPLGEMYTLMIRCRTNTSVKSVPVHLSTADGSVNFLGVEAKNDSDEFVNRVVTGITAPDGNTSNLGTKVRFSSTHLPEQGDYIDIAWIALYKGSFPHAIWQPNPRDQTDYINSNLLSKADRYIAQCYNGNSSGTWYYYKLADITLGGEYNWEYATNFKYTYMTNSVNCVNGDMSITFRDTANGISGVNYTILSQNINVEEYHGTSQTFNPKEAFFVNYYDSTIEIWCALAQQFRGAKLDFTSIDTRRGTDLKSGWNVYTDQAAQTIKPANGTIVYPANAYSFTPNSNLSVILISDLESFDPTATGLTTNGDCRRIAIATGSNNLPVSGSFYVGTLFRVSVTSYTLEVIRAGTTCDKYRINYSSGKWNNWVGEYSNHIIVNKEGETFKDWDMNVGQTKNIFFPSGGVTTQYFGGKINSSAKGFVTYNSATSSDFFLVQGGGEKIYALRVSSSDFNNITDWNEYSPAKYDNTPYKIEDYSTFDPTTLGMDIGQIIQIYSPNTAVGSPEQATFSGVLCKSANTVHTLRIWRAATTSATQTEYRNDYYNGSWLGWQQCTPSKYPNGLYVTSTSWKPSDSNLALGESCSCVINSNVTNVITGKTLTLTGTLSRRSDTVYNFVGGVDGNSMFTFMWSEDGGYTGAIYSPTTKF